MVSVTQKSIVLLGCFDTKGPDFSFLRACVLAYGESVITVNTGTYASTGDFAVDYEADQVATAANHTLAELQARADRGYAVDVMGRGGANILKRLHEVGKLKAVIGMGGGGGTYIALAAMQAIPLGIPKLCLSTVASKDLSRQVGSKDILLMPSVVDIAGLNSISRMLIKQAAAAVYGIVNVQLTEDAADTNGRIAISMFGNTTACVTACTELLQARGYEVFVFHANGVGGQTMESLIDEGCFDGVLDLTTTELADELCGGICSAGPARLEAAARCGVPQVVAPGCLDMVNFAHPDAVPPRYGQRQLYNWAPDVTLMRTDVDENKQLAEILTSKLNLAVAPVTILLPNKGLSQIDVEGGVFSAPQTNRILFETIRETASEKITVTELPFHINDKAFAHQAVSTLLQLMEHD